MVRARKHPWKRDRRREFRIWVWRVAVNTVAAEAYPRKDANGGEASRSRRNDAALRMCETGKASRNRRAEQRWVKRGDGDA